MKEITIKIIEIKIIEIKKDFVKKYISTYYNDIQRLD